MQKSAINIDLLTPLFEIGVNPNFETIRYENGKVYINYTGWIADMINCQSVVVGDKVRQYISHSSTPNRYTELVLNPAGEITEPRTTDNLILDDDGSKYQFIIDYVASKQSEYHNELNWLVSSLENSPNQYTSENLEFINEDNCLQVFYNIGNQRFRLLSHPSGQNLDESMLSMISMSQYDFNYRNYFQSVVDTLNNAIEFYDMIAEFNGYTITANNAYTGSMSVDIDDNQGKTLRLTRVGHNLTAKLTVKKTFDYEKDNMYIKVSKINPAKSTTAIRIQTPHCDFQLANELKTLFTDFN